MIEPEYKQGIASMRAGYCVRNFSAWIVALAACLVVGAASAEPATTVSLTRLACGEDPAADDVSTFSDTYAYSDFKFRLTYSCYLIRHGTEYMIWDTGNPLGKLPISPKVSLIEQLRELKLRPEQIKYVGISHYHTDHTGQLGAFPRSTLLIGKPDWDALTAVNPPSGMDAKTAAEWRAPFEHWISHGGKLDALTEDKKDVFGDGTVVMISTPGHTPGHHALLVRLKNTGNVLLTGDLAHFRENYDNNQVPTWNTSRADTLASLDRFKQIARNLKAVVIIQHDPRDIDKLPPFPAAAD
jgi:N-acyl homoserine lactone hydrolase